VVDAEGWVVFETAFGRLNNIMEQDHRAITGRVRASQGFFSLGVANASGSRNDEHDSQGTDPVVAEGRHRRAAAFVERLPGLTTA
jgi:hypothetical protein